MYTYRATVYNVVDGDTVDVNVDLGFKIYTKQRIRLNRINTPERGEIGFNAATDRLKELILNKEVTLITNRISKWGYYLGDIYINDLSINQIMMDEKLANPYNGGTK